MNIIQLIFVELKMELKTKVKYTFASLGDFIVFTITFLAVLFFTSVNSLNSHYDTHEGLMLMLIGYMLWNLGVVAMDTASQVIESDAKVGILEIEMQSKYPLWLLVIIRNFVANVYILLYLIILGVTFALFADLNLVDLLYAIVLVMLVAFVTNLGMLGIGFIFGAASLSFKKAGQWATIVQAAMILLSNVGMPLTNSFQLIIPYSGGIELARALYLGQTVPLISTMISLIVNVLWLVIGVLIMRYSVAYERKYGAFTAY